MAYYGVLAVGLIISIYFSFKRRNGFSADLLILKVISSLTFLLFGLVSLGLAFKKNELSFFGPSILMGGIFALCGDAFLDMKGLYEESKEKYMKAGFLSFFVCHIFYNFAMISEYKIKVIHVLIAIGVSILLALINISLAKPLKLNYRNFKPYVFAYSTVLILTTIISIISIIVWGYSVSRLLMIIGSVLFIVSDLILSNTYFKENCDGPVWYIVNHLSYYIAQFLIMGSIAADSLLVK